MDIKDLIFGTVGGLALFLYGMGLLSDGLKMAAGNRLRSLLATVTRRRLMALGVGAGVTCLIQSSSATTVMTVGLINAGLLTLKQAIAVVLGANIGTTITAWLVSLVAGIKTLKISTYAMPFIAIGFGMSMFSRRRSFKTTGQILLGLGLLFLGLHVMKDAYGNLGDKENSPIRHALMWIGDRPLLAVTAGAMFTMVIQSSSASIAMVILLATKGDFGTDPHEALRIAIPFILGDNIGTTITAQLAALRANLSGKRTAMAHTLFNVVGVIIIMPFVYTGLYARFVDFVYPAELTGLTLAWHISTAHTLFNVIAALAVLPFLGVLEAMVVRILPMREKDGEIRPVALEEHLLDTPPLAMAQAKGEIIRMARTARQAVDDAVAAVSHNDAAKVTLVTRKEEAVDNFQTQITGYLVALSQRQLAAEQSNEFPILLHTVNDLERISDHAQNIAEIAERKMRNRDVFSEHAAAQIDSMRDEVSQMFDDVLAALNHSDRDKAESALLHEETINRMQIDLRRSHVERLNRRTCTPTGGLAFVDLVNNLEKIGDHLTNIAQGVIGGLQWNGVEVVAPEPDGEL